MHLRAVSLLSRRRRAIESRASDGDAFANQIMGRQARAMSLRDDPLSFSTAPTRPGGRSRVFDDAEQSRATATRERNALTLFRFELTAGEVVQALVGSINGAQVSFGF